MKAATLPARTTSGCPAQPPTIVPALALAFELADVPAEGTRGLAARLMIAYDEIYAIKFLGQKLRPYWRRNGAGAATLLEAASEGLPRAWSNVAGASTGS